MTPDGIEPPFPERQSGVVPLDHEVVLRRERRRGGVVEVGVEPTESSGSRPDRFAELRTRLRSRTCLLVHEQRKLQARESHPAVQAYEAPLDTSPPAKL